MEYFFDTINFYLLKNYILKDPLIDWFNIQEYLENPKYIRDNQSYYKKYIIKESNEYKNKLLDEIITKSGLDIPKNTSSEETFKKINNNFPLIIKGELYSKTRNLLVNCDIIIRYDYFKKIFPKINNLPFHLLCKKKNYLLINTSYSSLKFKIDLKEIMNNGLIKYKKCNLYAFMKVFEELFNVRPPMFLMGKEYYYKKTQLPKQEFIGYVPFTKEIKELFLDAYEWIKELRLNYKNMDISPKPNYKELYPNMNNNESDWENEKYKLATEIKEITSVWNISYNERCDFLEKGIECWDDDKLLKNLKESKKRNIQERMIHMNKNTDILLYPRKNISSTFQEILSLKNDIYFDVESFLSFDEKQELLNDELNKRDPVLGILGFIHNGKYWNYTMNDFSLTEEKKIVTRFIDHLHKINNSKLINIYHWGHAEFNYLKYIKDKYPEIILPEYRLINVLDFFRTEPIIVQGVFKFGLKYIGEALYKNKLIKTTWGINDNGLDTMIEFKDVCKNNTKKIPLKRYSQIVDIIDYNRIDCQVLYEIVDLMKKTYL